MEFEFESPAAGRTKSSFALKTQNHFSSSDLSVCHPARKVSFNCGNSFDREGQAGLVSVCVCVLGQGTGIFLGDSSGVFLGGGQGSGEMDGGSCRAGVQGDSGEEGLSHDSDSR